MATIKYLLQNKSNNSNIYVRLSNGRGNVFKRKTGLTIDARDWSKKGMPKQNNASNKNLSVELNGLENFILGRLNADNSKGVVIDSDWLQKTIDVHFDRIGEGDASELVLEVIQTVIDGANVRPNSKGGLGLSKSRVNSLKALKRVFAEFQKSTSYKVKDVNVKLANDFLKFQLNECNYAFSTAQKKVSDLKSVCYHADREDIETHHQLKHIKAPRIKNEFIVYLSPEELFEIKNATLTKNYLINVRKWLLLGCFIGQRGGDLLGLTASNFISKNGLQMIELTQQKTGKNVVIPVLKELSEIVDAGLPHKISLAKFNKYVKEVCRLSGIDAKVEGVLLDKEIKRKKQAIYSKWQLVSSHICRRTFATNQYGQLPTPLIMAITGHSQEKTFLSYVGKSSYDYAQQIADYYAQQTLKEQRIPQLSVVDKRLSLKKEA